MSDTKQSGYWSRKIVDGHVYYTFVPVRYPRFSAAEAEELKKLQSQQTLPVNKESPK